MVHKETRPLGLKGGIASTLKPVADGQRYLSGVLCLVCRPEYWHIFTGLSKLSAAARLTWA